MKSKFNFLFLPTSIMFHTLSYFTVSLSLSSFVPRPRYPVLMPVMLFLIWLYTATSKTHPEGKYMIPASLPNGRALSMEHRRVRDVEEFELGLLEEDEESDKRDSTSIPRTPLAKRSSIDNE